MVGFYGIKALVLERVSANFIQQTNVTPLLTMIQEDPASLFSDVGEGGLKLKTAVAAQAEQGVAGQTL